eukprot:2569714-Prymnesium_polylepis.1
MRRSLATPSPTGRPCRVVCYSLHAARGVVRVPYPSRRRRDGGFGEGAKPSPTRGGHRVHKAVET